MKRLFCLLCALLLCCSLGTALAAGSAESTGELPEASSDPVPVSASGAARVFVLDPAPADRAGLAGMLADIFGAYTPRTYTATTYVDGQTIVGTEIVPGVAGLDWPWLSGVALFCLTLWSVYRLLGGLWK